MENNIHMGNIYVLSVETLSILMENNIYNRIHICELYVDHYYVIVENLKYKLEIYV